MLVGVSDQRLGSAIRLVRIRRRWRQADLAVRAGVSQATVSRVERGHLDSLSLRAVRSVASALDIRVDVHGRWRAGDLDRLLNAGHSALHESVARAFRGLPGWVTAPEVSFAVFGERGVIDILGWHAGRRALLVIELKTDISDVNELLGTAGRKRRLAVEAAAGLGWVQAGGRGSRPTVSLWVIVTPERTNRRRLEAHAAMVRSALPGTGRTMRAWLRDPLGPVAALSFWPSGHGGTGRPARRAVRRVRASSPSVADGAERPSGVPGGRSTGGGEA